MALDKLRGVNTRDPASPNLARRWRIVALVILVAVITLGVTLALVYSGRMTPLLDSL